MELFQSAPQNEPLAARMRPRNLNEYIGQNHIVGKGRLLRRAIKADQLSSLIFYGPPGTGKTTLARVIAGTTSSRFMSLNAVLSGVKEVRAAIAEAQELRDLQGRRTILFVDEVHRWNKAQQDALLPWVENGTIILIGATTENPYFEVNSALVSRSRIFQLKHLESEDLFDVARQAVTDRERGYGGWKVEFEEGALEHLVKTADGDARSLLNSLQLAVETTPASYPPPPGTEIHITLETAEESIQKKVVLYDKEGDYHYDTISAFIKSIRGSDPDATLYWLAMMVRAGEEPRYIFRRMLISASEDIGMADPQALGIVESAASAFDRVGLPEGRFHLTQAALYLATAPKSNTSLAFFDALAAVEQEFAKEVPNHLKDTGRDKEGFGHGAGYLYPHAYKDHWVAQQYLPSGLQGRIFYEPSGQGYEGAIRERLTRQREIQLTVVTEDTTEEVLTFSPPDKGSERWLYRVNRETGKTLTEVRDRMFSTIQASSIARHECILVLEPGVPVFLWEAVRSVPEGTVYYLPSGEREAEICRHYAISLPEENRPIELSAEQTPAGQSSVGMSQDKNSIVSAVNNIKKQLPDGLKFEKILLRDGLTYEQDKTVAMRALKNLLSDKGKIIISQFIPSAAQRLSELSELTDLKEIEPEFYTALKTAEDKIYSNPDNSLVNWSPKTIATAAEDAGFNISQEAFSIDEKRPIQAADIDKWFDTKASGYGSFLSRELDKDDFSRLTVLINERLSGRIVQWKLNFFLITAS